MKEIVIQVRQDSLSIQAGNIQNNTGQAKNLLQDALAALNQTPKSEHRNELVFEKPKS